MNRATLDEIPTQSLSVYTLRLAAPYFPFFTHLQDTIITHGMAFFPGSVFFFLDLLEADAWIEKLLAALDAAFPF